MTATDEHEDLERIRRRAADLSMGLGLIALLVGGFTKVLAMLPGYVLLVLGGLVAIGVYRARDVAVSRRFSALAAALTVIGIGALVLADQLGG